MIWVLYYLAMYLMTAGIRFSALWNMKSKQWAKGRKGWVEKIKLLPEKSGKRIWFHVSSLGEFEQARPVIENLKRNHSGIEIILTFFSPSGYEIKSKYTEAHVFYLPADLPGNAQRWITIVQPDFAVFVKYDLWAGYLNLLQKENIPTILISAHWQPGDAFHSSALPPTRNLLKKFNRIFLQKGEYLGYYEKKGFSNLAISGDTRIDRSLELAGEVNSRLPEAFRRFGHFDIVAGSTWPADEKLLIAAAGELELKMIIAPHDVSKQNIKRLLATIPFPSICLSEMTKSSYAERIVVVDSIGLLNVLYSLGRIAYVGGGFGKGIHNILEPAAHHKPILFGPAFAKFPEAIDLIACKAAWSIAEHKELTERIKQLLTSGSAEQAGEIAFNYLVSNAGASKQITHYILQSSGENNLTNDN